MQELENKIGYKFKDISLLEEALTHSSYANEHKSSSYTKHIISVKALLFSPASPLLPQAPFPPLPFA